MKIGHVIRNYRKEKGFTQEEMANRLGVSTPAVNKWENDVSLPDVTMLMPLARLLGISVDTLLSFRENLTEEEVRVFINRLWEQLNQGEHESAFLELRRAVETYPNCFSLMVLAAQAFEAYYLVMPQHKSAESKAFLHTCFLHGLESEEERVRIGAAEALFNQAVREEDYDGAESYLRYFSIENPERKRKQAFLYGKTGRMEDACRTYEELLYTGCQTARMIFQNLYSLAKEQGDMERAGFLAEKHCELVRVYDMGEYAEAATVLEYAIDVKNEEMTMELLERLMNCVDTLQTPKQSRLYGHMQFNQTDVSFTEQLRCKLKQEFKNDDRLSFVRESPRFQKLVM